MNAKRKINTDHNSEESSNSNSLTRSNQFAAPNDFIFSTSQYKKNSKDFETILNIKEAANFRRKPNNQNIATGISNMKRRNRKQDLIPDVFSGFGSSFSHSNDKLPDGNMRGRDQIKTKYNSFKNSPLMSSNKSSMNMIDSNQNTIYRKNSGLNNFWQVSASGENSFLGMKKNRSRDGIMQRNLRQNLNLKLKKRIFNNQKKNIVETRREINMPTINSQNRQIINQKVPQISKENSLRRNIPKEVNNKVNTSLDTYHTKSFENVMNGSTSVIFKNLNKINQENKIQPQGNKKILAILASKKQFEAQNFTKKNRDIIVAEENPLEVSDAYSYGFDTKKGSIKLKTQDSTTDHLDSIQSESNNGDKTSLETYQTKVKGVQKHKSFTNSDPQDDKKMESDRRVTEYDSTIDKDFQSPMDYKAVSPSPNLNTSAMSKEVGLDDRTSKLKEDEKDFVLGEEVVSFPLSAAKTIIHFGKYLSEYEESEILNYMVIYYINTNERGEESPEKNINSPK